MSNYLIVEGKNDEIFVKAMVEHLSLSQIEIGSPPICKIDDYECLGGLNEKALKKRLKSLKNDLPQKDIQSLGIIIDQDNETREDRINLINEAVRSVFDTHEILENTSEFISIQAESGGEEFNLKLACFLMNVDGKGELDTVLKAIAAKDTIYADCLESWRDCLESKKKKISDKDFDKFWVSNYIRFDTCSRKEKKQAGKKCSMSAFEHVMKEKKSVWNLDHHVLEDFKNFLNLFSD